MNSLRLRTLGPLVLLDEAGAALITSRRKELALLAYLARHAGRPVRRTELLDLLWGDRPEENARLSLRQALLRLRRVVGDTLVVTPDAVTLAPGTVRLDLAEVEADLDAERAADALARWEGEFLVAAEDAGGARYRTWVQAERAAARRRVAAVLERLIARASSRGVWDEVIDLATRWRTVDPDDERPHVALVGALLVRQRVADAAAQHAAFLTTLDRAPSREIDWLDERIEQAVRAASSTGSPGSAARFTPDMVGREAAHAELVAAWRRARAGAATVVVVAGEAGIGRTRLVDEFLRGLRSEQRRVLVLHARGHAEPDAAPLGTLRELLAGIADAPGLAGASPAHLAELSSLVPAVRNRFPQLPGAIAASPEGAAIAEPLAAVSAEIPVIVALDDIDAADAGTRVLLTDVIRRLHDARVLFILTSPDARLVSALRDRSPRVIRLAPLGEAAIDALLASMIVMRPDARAALASRLHRERGGNPFDVVETLTLLMVDGLLAPDAAGEWRLAESLADRALPVPGTVREAVRGRAMRLSPEATRVLLAAASIDAPFTLEALVRATRSPESLVADALDQLVTSRFVRAGGEAGVFEVALHSAHLAGLEPTDDGRRRRGRRIALIAAAGAAAAAALLFVGIRERPVFASSGAPLVAVTGIDAATGDSTDAWLAQGMSRLIESKLARATDLDIVPAAQVEAVLQRAGARAGAPVTTARALDLGRRLGATWVLGGRVVRADSVVVLEYAVHDVRTGKRERAGVVTAADVFAAADGAAAKLLALAGNSAEGPALTDVETSSTAAFEQFIRASRAQTDGRATTALEALDAAIALDSGFGSALLLRAATAHLVGDAPTFQRLTGRLNAQRDRLSPRDRLHWDALQALMGGDRARARHLVEALVRRYPWDPRGLALLADLYYVNGQWEALDALARATLARDSLGIAAGAGPCFPCVTYQILVENRWRLGDRAGAERAARRWVEVQPASSNAQHHLAKTLARLQRTAEAERVAWRGVELSGNDEGAQAGLARVLLMLRRREPVDSMVRAWRRSSSPALQGAVIDIESLLALERGDTQRMIPRLREAIRADARNGWLALVLGTYEARAGHFEAAAATLEAHGHRGSDGGGIPTGSGDARNFVWSHALLADALAPTGDTARLRAIADSMERAAAYSYFSRDWKLHHHVRGLIAMRAGRHAEAEREFRQARWGATGWPRTLAELAKAQLAQGRPADAVETLRNAYEWPDAMARYHAVRETDSLLAVAFAGMGERDSARVYEDYVTTARRESAVQNNTVAPW